MSIDRDEFLMHVELIRTDIRGVNERLDKLNDRTRQNEQDIAVLEDRQDSERPAAASGKAAAAYGASAAGVVMGAYDVIKWWIGK